ncbi:MAG: nuclear transport factor 2 family protein [Gammaproteobacteria bacterium]|nr:nuclear transport factor 2 family protein [Gammaproteobacteria bacterium]
MTGPPTTIAEIAADFTAMWLAGHFHAAGEKYWADDVVSIEPRVLPNGTAAVCQGIEAVRAKYQQLLATHGIEDLSLDGPFVTGNHFALFVDMLVVHGGRRRPCSEIVVFTVRDSKIVEERYFHD